MEARQVPRNNLHLAVMRRRDEAGHGPRPVHGLPARVVPGLKEQGLYAALAHAADGVVGPAPWSPVIDIDPRRDPPIGDRSVRLADILLPHIYRRAPAGPELSKMGPLQPVLLGAKRKDGNGRDDDSGGADNRSSALHEPSLVGRPAVGKYSTP
jgi:hypothetical protein